MLAYQRVIENKGTAGVDQLAVSELKDHLQRHWPTIRTRLLAGELSSATGAAGDLPKPEGGERRLGIPTVVDRFIQQALLRCYSRCFEPDLLGGELRLSSGAHAHQAVAAQAYVAHGHSAGWWTLTSRNSSTGSTTTC